MTKINLIPKESIIKESHPEIAALIVAVFAFIVLILGYTYVSKVTKRAAIKKEIIYVDNELAKLQTVIDQIARIKAQKDALNAKKSALEALNKSRLVYPIFMEDLVKILPPGMWLLNLNTKSDPANTQVNFNASAYDNYIIADLLQALENSDRFHGPEISGITTSVSADRGTIKQFAITVNYRNQEWK
ncbi:MAG: hypothetical protein A2474_07010 [Elusimicrobia bacterium RIFOXYC2_FULL_34_12]|nr:MAG: hypothetical protein A2474_07010 [Elusimicrobia bacterium RIFOXYC2_FULL_34_12]OGS39384.1 MAG: hypothetical protein A2551_05710 [Elusimicrobia bacterium RIFOXYD2_FULL_34_30]